KGRSSLRLKPSASGSKSAKAASKGGKGKAPAFPDLNRDPDDDEESEDELNSSPTQKRQPESPPPPPSRYRKRGTSHPHHQPHDPTTDPTSSNNNNPPNQTAHLPPTPSTSSSSPPTSPPPPTSDPSQLSHTADPLQENTWTCALDGCTHKVYLASDPASQRLIRDHYKLHAYDDDERVRLVGRLQAPSLPVGHLMERVRLVARRRDGGRGEEDGSGEVGGGAEEEEVDERKVGGKREDGGQEVMKEKKEEVEEKGLGRSHLAVERAKMPSSRYPPPAPTAATAAAAIEPIVQRY
ncbi:hypothetical protein KC326_g7716, partial [Hortaea werneckii]